MTPMRRSSLLLFASIILSLLCPSILSAQYFGQNKVRYETVDFQVLKTEHFDIHYYNEEAAVARDVARMAERWYVRLSRVLQHNLPPHQPVVLYANHAAFRATSIIPDDLGESTGGVTEGLRRRVILPMAGPLAETDHVLGHELVHAFQYDITSGTNVPGAEGLPLWFIEGMAEYFSLGPVDSSTAMWMRDAVRRDDVPALKKLDDFRYFPYRYGQAFWAFVGGTYGDETIGLMLRYASKDGIEQAIHDVLHTSSEDLSREWREALLRHNEPVLRATTPPSDASETLIPASKPGEGLNVGPVVSPDGTEMVLFSQKDLISIDLYIVDVETGRFKKKITNMALDPHIDSLQFVSSAGGWSSDGHLFAFADVNNGRPELTIYNVQTNRVERRERFPNLGEIINASWSPDGGSIAFSAISEGVTDLFVFDLRSGSLRQLTHDAFADLQPAWSPNGQSIAFVTDRFTSNLPTLSFGGYRLALLNVATGGISALNEGGEGRSINPQWSADGNTVFFISDLNGIPNLYRIEVQSRSVRQLTNLQTGVSGITHLSPAFSVASHANRLVYTVFEDGNYSIHRLNGQALNGTSVSTAVASLNAGVLPPASTSRSVTELLENPRLGLATSDDFSTNEYKPRLQFDNISPPEFSVGTSSFGSLVGGGTAFSWSDLLGQHTLTTAVQSSFSTGNGGGFVNNFAAVVGYLNQKSRWNWGFTGGQVPFVTGEFNRAIVDTPNGPVVFDESTLFFQRNRELNSVFQYPFNRARRLEFTAGYQNISFDGKLQREVFDPVTGDRLANDTTDIPTEKPLNMGTASAAYVYDTSVFGGVSPITGQRYRFELSGSKGTLNYMTFLADYRRYQRVARPLILAGRLMHISRFANDSEDRRLQNFFLGETSLVRGYDPGSFTPGECGSSLQIQGTCPVFDQLIGSRLVVANAEARVPLLGALGVIPSSGIPPVELAFFYDAGTAWTRGEKATFLNGPRPWVTSQGATLRVNILGFAIGEVSYVHPNDRPDKRWVWEFGINSGF
jgi:hypothetical protein